MNDMENKRKVIDILIVVSMPFQTIFIIIFWEDWKRPQVSLYTMQMKPCSLYRWAQMQVGMCTPSDVWGIYP